MAECGTSTFCDPDCYSAGFGDVRIKFTITGPGGFETWLTQLKLDHLEVYRCCENLPRIAYISLPPSKIFVSIALGRTPLTTSGFALRGGDIVLHSRGERMHQRSAGACEWGLISLSPEHFASCGKALMGRPITAPLSSKPLRPSRADATSFQRLFRQACHLATDRKRLIERAEVARALEQELLHAIINCLAADSADDHAEARHHHAAIMSRYEEALERHTEEKLYMPTLCAEIGVAERILRMCCTEFLGVSPARYVLLQRLNKARSALRRADPTTTSVAEVARNHRFLEFGRFALTYRNTFGESPSTTLQRASQAAEIA
jgi:AraC-like DNA-binding protein